MSKQFTIKSRIKEMQLFRGRIIFVVFLIMVLSLLLIARLVTLQIFQYSHYTTLSKKNDIDFIPIPPKRGLIYDRNGLLLAKNEPVFNLMLTPSKVASLKQTLQNIQKIIPLSQGDLDQFNKQVKQYRRFDEVPLKLKLSQEEVASFAVNSYLFPGVSVKTGLIRTYPLRNAFAHVVGYVGRINQKELAHLDASNYAATNFIGKVGIEKYYEPQLHGKVGYKEVEIEASGKVVRKLKEIPPQNGADIYLTIDGKLQIVAEEALANLRGAVVVIDTGTGEILALASEPGYNPNDFVVGISNKDYKKLRSDPDYPLYNRALRGLYAPGSVIKPFVALAGLDGDIVTPGFKIFDPGWYKLPNSEHVFHDWKRSGHGWINLSGAIIQSCDTYFYGLSHKLGIDAMDNILQQFGFGELTNVDMGEELKGTVPSPAWKLKNRGMAWYPGDTVITGIGQGYLQVTPLQLAAATAILANRGLRFQSHLLYAMRKPVNNGKLTQLMPVTETPIEINDLEYWDIVINAMSKVVSKGTGYRFGRNVPYPVAAKTGTAQVYSSKQIDNAEDESNLPMHLRNNSTFIVFTPVDHPKIAVAVVVENSPVAANVARKVVDYYMKSRS
jgi:penicillin-binding protein 2